MIQELFAPYTPKHNDDGERRNMTILNMARNMLKRKKLPQVMGRSSINYYIYFE